MYYKSQRSYLNVDNGVMYDMYVHNETKDLKLVSANGETVTKFVCCAHHCEMAYKMADGTIFNLKHGEFKEVQEMPVKRKFKLFSGWCNL